MMNFVVVGMDNTGKTTVVKHLSEYFENTPWTKSPGPVSREEQMDWMKSNIELSKSDWMIFERFPFFDEQVYGKVLRGKSNFNLNDEDMVELFNDNNVIVIYCRPPKETILDFGDRPQMDGIIANAGELINAWDELMLEVINRKLPVVTYNYKEENATEKLETMLLSHLAEMASEEMANVIMTTMGGLI